MEYRFVRSFGSGPGVRACLGLGDRGQQVSAFLEHSQRDPERFFDLRGLFRKQHGSCERMPGVAPVAQRGPVRDSPQHTTAARAVERDLLAQRIDRGQIAQDTLCNLGLDRDIAWNMDTFATSLL